MASEIVSPSNRNQDPVSWNASDVTDQLAIIFLLREKLHCSLRTVQIDSEINRTDIGHTDSDSGS